MARKVLPVWNIIRTVELSFPWQKSTAFAYPTCIQARLWKTRSTLPSFPHDSCRLVQRPYHRPTYGPTALVAKDGRRCLATSSSTREGSNGNKKKRRGNKKTGNARQHRPDKKVVATPVNSAPAIQPVARSDIPPSPTVTTPPPSPSLILDELARLIHQLQLTNSANAKREILLRFSSLAPILQWTYDPYRQFHVTAPHVIKYALAKASTATSESDPSQPQHTNCPQRLWDSGGSDITAYNTLHELLEALTTRSISGHKAKDSIMLFLDRFCREEKDREAVAKGEPPTSLKEYTAQLLQSPRSQTFFKILDKNLKAGCSVGLISSVFPDLIPRFHVALGNSLLKLDDARKLFPPSSLSQVASTPMYKDQDTNGIDKGNKEANRHSLPSPITSSVTSGTESRGAWFGSRKLDGVRCLITINLATGEAEAMSRSGRPFATLGDIEKAVSDMVGGDSLEQRTKFFAIATGHNFPYQSNTDTTTKSFTSETATETRTKGNKDRLLMHPSSLPESLILDGEICVLDASQMTRTPLSGGKGEEQAIKTEEGPFDFDHGGIGQENFLKTIGYILRSASPSAPLSTDLKEASKKRKKKSKGQALEEEDDLGADGDREDDPLKSLSHINKAASSEATNIQPVYCIFDCLTEQEFRDRKGTRPFSQRIQNLWRAMNYARTSQTLPPNSNNDTIRILPQHRISSFEQLEQIVAQSLERDWEGVMLRKDVGYEGRRSRNLLKIKKFQDAEFVVEDVMTGKMRLPDPITGQFEEREVLTSVVIRHKGSPVRVGSGFSVEDRIRYGQQPSLILGKTITVQYFEESTSIRSSALSSGQEGSLDSPRTGSRDDDEANGSVSLRFPTVKAIYESGEREV